MVRPISMIIMSILIFSTTIALLNTNYELSQSLSLLLIACILIEGNAQKFDKKNKK